VDKDENLNVSAPRFKVFMPGIILGVVALLAIGSITLAIVLRQQGRDIFSPNQMQVYFFNPLEGRLNSEGRQWPYGNQHDWVSAALGHLRFPNSSRLVSTWPDINPLLGVEEIPFFMNAAMNESTLIIDFHDSYLDVPPLHEALFRSALTLTMVGLPFIDEVKIRVGDNEWIESAETIANAPSLSPARLTSTQLVIYFIDESGEGLIREYYNAVEIDARRQAQAALQRLIDGPVADGMFSAIPAETRVLAIIPILEPPRSIYVNLSGDFLRFVGTPAQTRLVIASIVNTVLENSGPGWRQAQVFFLIDSSREQLPGIDDFTRGFIYDETAVLGFLPNDAYDFYYEQENGE